MNEAAVIRLLRSEIGKAKSQADWARQHSISNAYVVYVAKGRQPPGVKILDALGLERIVIYRRKINGRS